MLFPGCTWSCSLWVQFPYVIYYPWLLTPWHKDSGYKINTLRPRRNGRYFAHDDLNCILFNEKAWISTKCSLKCVRKCLINNIPPFVRIMAWRRTGDKPLSELLMAWFTDAYMRHLASMSAFPVEHSASVCSSAISIQRGRRDFFSRGILWVLVVGVMFRIMQ